MSTNIFIEAGYPLRPPVNCKRPRDEDHQGFTSAVRMSTCETETLFKMVMLLAKLLDTKVQKHCFSNRTTAGKSTAVGNRRLI
jgi:hypothetical protein